jgi:hypothetical protein
MVPIVTTDASCYRHGNPEQLQCERDITLYSALTNFGG